MSSIRTLKVAPVRRGDMEMKIFDWKKRLEFQRNPQLPEDYFLAPHTIFPNPGQRHRRKIVGRGYAAGQGKSGGRGMKGQNSRSGGGVKKLFEGGQTPFFKRIPKIGKANRGFVTEKYKLIKVEMLNHVEPNTVVDFELLRDKGLITKISHKQKLFKVVGGDVKLDVPGLTVKAHAFSQSANDTIVAAGGTCLLLSRTMTKVPKLIADSIRKKKDALIKAKTKAMRELKRKTRLAKEKLKKEEELRIKVANSLPKRPKDDKTSSLDKLLFQPKVSYKTAPKKSSSVKPTKKKKHKQQPSKKQGKEQQGKGGNKKKKK